MGLIVYVNMAGSQFQIASKWNMLIIYLTDSGKNPKHRICINYTVIHQQDHSSIFSMINIQKLFWKIMETKTRKVGRFGFWFHSST